jgi:hypothetical protein
LTAVVDVIHTLQATIVAGVQAAMQSVQMKCMAGHVEIQE